VGHDAKLQENRRNKSSKTDRNITIKANFIHLFSFLRVWAESGQSIHRDQAEMTETFSSAQSRTTLLRAHCKEDSTRWVLIFKNWDNYFLLNLLFQIVFGHHKLLVGLAVHPDEEMFATAGQDKYIALWRRNGLIWSTQVFIFGN